MRKVTGAELEFISDIAMYFFVEKYMRGGISYIAKDTVKPISTWNCMMIISRVNRSSERK